MPNLITHTIFCEKVYKTITDKKYRTIIEMNKKEYLIGTNGPDFLFFHDMFPLVKKQEETIPMIGTTFHRKYINAFYKVAIQTYRNQKKGSLKDAMASYLIGHYLHWQLDSVMHPYVVYRTGFKEENSKYYHHRFESMMDTILLKRCYNETIKTFETYKLCKRSKLSVEAISAIYLPCIEQCQGIIIDKKTIKQALADWEKTQLYLYDPHGIKYALLKGYEAIIRKPWLFSGNMVRNKIDYRYDVMNDKQEEWLHPCTGDSSHESVMDLLDKAIKDATKGLPLLFAAMDKKSMEPLLKFIDNKTYANGIKGNLPRQYKKVIYNQ